MGNFRFFLHRPDFLPNSSLRIKKWFNKKSFKFSFIKSKKNHGDSVKNESAMSKKNRLGGRQMPPSSLFRVKIRYFKNFRVVGSFVFFERHYLSEKISIVFKNLLDVPHLCFFPWHFYFYTITLILFTLKE